MQKKNPLAFRYFSDCCQSSTRETIYSTMHIKITLGKEAVLVQLRPLPLFLQPRALSLFTNICIWEHSHFSQIFATESTLTFHKILQLRALSLSTNILACNSFNIHNFTEWITCPSFHDLILKLATVDDETGSSLCLSNGCMWFSVKKPNTMLHNHSPLEPYKYKYTSMSFYMCKSNCK